MLYISDVVISDYSCIIYEAAILDKPLYFYTYDYEDYMSSREIYMDYKAEIPGPMEGSAKALLDDIDAGNYDMDRLHTFLHKYVFTKVPMKQKISSSLRLNIEKPRRVIPLRGFCLRFWNFLLFLSSEK